jgi:hypothetical protein
MTSEPRKTIQAALILTVMLRQTRIDEGIVAKLLVLLGSFTAMALILGELLPSQQLELQPGIPQSGISVAKAAPGYRLTRHKILSLPPWVS